MNFGYVMRSIAATLAGILVIGNWVYLSIARPKIQWGGQFQSEAEIQQYALLGVAMCFAAVSMIGRTSWRAVALMLFGILIDLVIGRAIYLTPIPLYLDTIGCVLVAVLLGSRYGAFVAGTTALLLYPVAPALLPLAIINITVAALAGLLAQYGGFSAVFPVVLSALFTGTVSTIISTPIVLYFAGNLVSANDGVIYSVLENLLGSLFGPPISDGTPSDLLDKLIVFWIVVGVIKLLERTSVLKSLTSRSPGPLQH